MAKRAKKPTVRHVRTVEVTQTREVPFQTVGQLLEVLSKLPPGLTLMMSLDDTQADVGSIEERDGLAIIVAQEVEL